MASLTPAASERSQIHVKFWLPQTGSVRQRARGVRNSLEISLSGDVVLNLGLQRGVVAVDESVDDFLQREGRVTSPRVPVIRVVLAG